MGGSAPKVQESAAERQQAASAKHRWEERQQDGYVDLEKQDVAHANDDYSHFLGGRNSADTAVAEKQAYATVGAPTAEKLGSVANSVGEAVTTGRADARSAALGIRDANTISAMKRGNDVAADSSTALDAAAKMAGSRAINKVQNQILVNNSRTSALLSAADGAVQGNAMRKAGYKFGADGITAPDKMVNGETVKGKNMGLGSVLLSGFKR